MVRLKHRYLILQLVPEDPASTYAPEATDVVASIQQPFTEMFGLFGAGSVLTVIRLFNWIPQRRLGVLRVPAQWAPNVLHFFSTLEDLSGLKLSAVVHHVSGTIDQAQAWMSENDSVFL